MVLYPLSFLRRDFLRFETRAYADFCFEELGNRAARFSSLDRRIKFGLVGPGNLRNEVQMALGNGKAVADFVERNCRGRFKLLRGHACTAQLGGKSHCESTSVRRCEQFLGICSDAVLEARAE